MTTGLKPRLRSVTVPDSVGRKANRAAEVSELPNYLRILSDLPANLSLFSMGQTAPVGDSTNTPWIKVLPDGTPDGLWIFNTQTGAWYKNITPTPTYFDEMCTVYLSTTHSIVNWALFDEIEFDTKGGFVKYAAQGSYEVQTSGKFLVTAKVRIDNLPDPVMGFYIQRWSESRTPATVTIAISYLSAITGTTAEAQATGVAELLAGDLVTVRAGVSIPARWVGGTQDITYMSIMRVG